MTYRKPIPIDKKIEKNIDNLNNNWMHKVSMSSLELFYSNFFECMFNENPNHILKALGIESINIPEELKEDLKLIIVREFNLGKSDKSDNSGKGKNEITDIMIGFEIKINEKQIIIPYIIIENKVKSYPQNEQLKGQHDALKNYLCKQLQLIQKYTNNINTCFWVANFYGIINTYITTNIDTIVEKCHEILLTYIPAHEDVFNDTRFKPLLYMEFKERINQYESPNHSQYINDYYNMVTDICAVLSALQVDGKNVINPEMNLKDHPYYMADEFEALQAIDFQDVFRKYQASLFEAYLRTRFQIDPAKPIYKEIKVRTEGMMYKNGTTTFLLVLKGAPKRHEEELSIGVQVEGNVFRVMVVGKIIENTYIKNNIPYDNLATCIKDMWEDDKCSAKQGFGQKRNGKKCGYNRYDPDCIYKYYDITGNPTFEELGNKIAAVLDYIVNNKDVFMKNIP